MNKYDKMIACNRKASAEKIDLARRTIFEMVEEGEKVTIPKLIAKTGLSRGFFYKNPMVRQALDKALEQQVGMIDPRRSVLDMAMDNEIVALHERIRELQQENQRLRKLLGLREQRSDLKFEAARVTQRDVSNWASTLVLNRGSQHGVAENDCAVDCYGNLVGVVTEVGLNWCRLTTILDTGSQLGAMVFRTEETAIAAGDQALMSQGKLKLSYLPDGAQLVAGDEVVTSGKGDVFPSGLVVGTVEAVFTDPSGMNRYAVVEPDVDLDSLVEVFVIKSFDIVE